MVSIGLWQLLIVAILVPLIIAPIILLLIGAISLFKTTKHRSAILILLGAILLGLSYFEPITSMFLSSEITETFPTFKELELTLTVISNILASLGYLGPLFLGVGLYLHAKFLEKAQSA